MSFSVVENPFINASIPFDAELCGYGACVPQPNGLLLDSLSHFTMFRFSVRDVNGTLGGVVTHTVDLGGNLAGSQWADIDLSGPSPALAGGGVLNVGDGLHRWMSSASRDARGNMALGYSRSGAGEADFPSVYFTGRLATDPAGSLQAESECIAGTGSQEGGSRWGDYSTVSIDPVDDCTFWLTNEYVETTGSFQWDTQVCTFRFPGCGVIDAAIDIKFCSDPNGFNCKKKGKTPVTIFGTAALDVSDIDISSLQLCLADDTDVCVGPPQSWSVADRGDPDTDIGAAQCALNEETGEEEDFLNQDGLEDLDVTFDSRDLADLPGFGCPLGKGEASATLVLKGLTNDGTEFMSVPVGDPGIDQLANQGKAK